jgi:hypothetical protein
MKSNELADSATIAQITVLLADDHADFRKSLKLLVELDADIDLSYAQYLFRLRNDPKAINLKVLSRIYDVHHLDGNAMNDTRSNLEVMLGEDHDRLHSDETKFNVQYTILDSVEAVHPCGREATYDIQMELPDNSFATADGLILQSTAGL